MLLLPVLQRIIDGSQKTTVALPIHKSLDDCYDGSNVEAYNNDVIVPMGPQSPKNQETVGRGM